jgi:hypothetical protein
MSRQYYQCENCHANLDPGEKCDCKKGIEDYLVICVDIANNGDEACLQVTRRLGLGNRFEVIKTCFGDEAKRIYDLLTKKNKKGLV